jgi:hypothetical protein
MSYKQLRRIADNDSIADLMSEKEYESLSVQLWRKFGVEKGITLGPPLGRLYLPVNNAPPCNSDAPNTS